jgi:hypothetical protein
MKFADRALPYVRMGINVIPLRPATKDAYWTAWPEMLRQSGLPSEEDIQKHSKHHPSDNVGAVAELKLGGALMIDADSIKLIAKIEADTSQKMPETMIVRSGRKAWAAHYYFVHTEYSLARLKNSGLAGLGQVQIRNKYVVGAGSVHPDTGNTYESNGAAILPIPDWLTDWLAGCSDPEKPKKVSAFMGEHGDVGEKKEWVENFNFRNGVEVRGEWENYTAPGGQKGFRIDVFCPNEEHHSMETKPSSTSILVAEGLGLDFKCHHGHCGALTWNDFRAHYERAPDIGEWKKKKEPTAAPDEKAEAPNVHARKTGDEIPFPMDLMDCKLGKIARTLEAPPAWSFFSTMAFYAAQGVPYTGSLQTNQYTGLLAESGGGKSLVAERARQTFVYQDPDMYKDILVSSDNALAQVLGAVKVDEWDELTAEQKRPRPVMLYQDEGKNLLTKADAPGNTGVIHWLDQLYYKDHAGKKLDSNKKLVVVYVHLTMLLGLTIETPADFAEIFGRASIEGLFRRMMLADGPKDWIGRDNWQPEPVILRPQASVSLPDNIADAKMAWTMENVKTRRNLAEFALRAAISIASAENRKADRLVANKSEVPGAKAEDVWTVGLSKDDMALGLMIAEYQEKTRQTYKPGIADCTPNARCTQTVLRGLETIGPEVVVNARDFKKKHKLSRYGTSVVNSVLMGLNAEGIIYYGKDPDEDGKSGRPHKIIVLYGDE